MPGKLKEISGIVVPAKWDKAGNVIGTAIQSFDENEYLIEQNRSGVVFKDLLHESVIVSGKTRERLDGKKMIRVVSVESL